MQEPQQDGGRLQERIGQGDVLQEHELHRNSKTSRPEHLPKHYGPFGRRISYTLNGLFAVPYSYFVAK